MAWMETIAQKLERERKLREQFPEFEVAPSPDRVMQVDNHNMQNGGSITRFSQAVMQVARHVSELANESGSAPMDVQFTADRLSAGIPGYQTDNYTATPQKRAGVPLGVAEAFPEEAAGRRTYGTPGSTGEAGQLWNTPVAEYATNLPIVGGGVQHALNTPYVGDAIAEATRPRTWAEMAVLAPVASGIEAAGIGGRIAAGLLTPLGADAGIAANVAGNVGMNLGAHVGADVAGSLTQNAPAPVQAGAQVLGGLVGGGAGLGAVSGVRSALARGGVTAAVTPVGKIGFYESKSLDPSISVDDFASVSDSVLNRLTDAEQAALENYVGLREGVDSLRYDREMVDSIQSKSEPFRAWLRDMSADGRTIRAYRYESGEVPTNGLESWALSPKAPRAFSNLYSGGKGKITAADINIDSVVAPGASRDLELIVNTHSRPSFPIAGITKLATGYRDLTKGIPVGASIKDIGGELNALDEQVKAEGGWTAQTIAKYQELTGRRPTASMTRPAESIGPPNTSPEGIRQGAGNAIVKGQGAANINLSEQIPLLKVFDALDAAKAVAPEQKANVAALRVRQAGAFQGTSESVLGQGEAGFRQAAGAMRGQAEQATYTPLRSVLDQGSVDSVYNELLQSDASPFTRRVAGDAFGKMLDGQPLTDSDFKAFEHVFGPDAMEQIKGKLKRVGGFETGPNWWQEALHNPVRAVNQSIRASRLYTLVDMSFMARLAPTAGAYDMPLYVKTVGQAFHALQNPKVVEQVLKGVDDKAVAMLADDGIAFLPDTIAMREAGLRFGKSEITDLNPGILGKIPILGRGAKVDQTFTTMLRPQMMQSTVENMVNGGKLTVEQARDPEVLTRIAKGLNNITGASNIIQHEGVAETFLSFPNWLSSQFELVGRAVTDGSISGNLARQSLTKMILIATAATAGGNLAQGKDPRDYLRDGIPQLAVGDGTTVDLYGPIGELIRHGIAVGRAGYEGATPEGGGFDLAGGTGAVGHESAWWARGMLSPAAGIAVDLLLGTDYLGYPVRDTMGNTLSYAARSVAPFTATNYLGLGEKGGDFFKLSDRGILANTASELGFRGVRVQSLNDQLTEAGNKMAEQGAFGDGASTDLGFYDRSPSEQAKILEANPDLAQQRSNQRIAKGGDKAALEEKRIEYRRQQQEDDTRVLNGEIDWKQWKDNRSRRMDQLRGFSEAVYGNDPIANPKDAYERWLNQVHDSVTNDGVDWNAVDAWVAQQPAKDQQYIADNTGIYGTELEKQRRTVADKLDASGYFDIRDRVWQRVAAQDDTASGYKTMQDFENAVAKRFRSQLADRGITGVAAEIMASDLIEKLPQVKMWSKVSNDIEEMWIKANPQLAGDAIRYGYLDPSSLRTAEKSVLVGGAQ